jgi:murein DD-endopeptidase MepM/ murein hydrolase activator NlpD
VASERAAERGAKRLGWTIRITDTTEIHVRTDIVVRTPKAFRLPGRRPRRSFGYRALSGLAYLLIVVVLMALALAVPAAGILGPSSAGVLARIPWSSATAPLAASTLAAPVTIVTAVREGPKGLSTHLVERGETLFSIAARYGVSPQTLAFNNGLSDTAEVRPGRTLLVTPPNVALYEPKDGETVDEIAARYGADAEAVRALNAIEFEPTDVVPGRILVIPVADPRYPGFRLRISDRPRVLTPKLRLPVEIGVITQRFSPAHHGVDIAAPYGTPILATGDGTVTASGWHVGTGGLHVCVLLDWGLESCAFHAAQVLVELGERVLIGQAIALVGSTGHSTGPHVHWEARANGALVDPLTWAD